MFNSIGNLSREELIRLVVQLRANNEELQRRLDELGSEDATRLKGDNTTLRTENGTLRGEKQKLGEENFRLEAENVQVKEEKRLSRERNEVLRKENQQLRNQLASATTTTTTEDEVLVAANNRLVESNRTLRTEISELASSYSSLQGQVRAVGDERQRLRIRQERHNADFEVFWLWCQMMWDTADANGWKTHITNYRRDVLATRQS